MTSSLYGQTLVKDIYLGAQNSVPEFIGVINSKLIFTASTAAEGQELWNSDGTTIGTTLLKDLGNDKTKSFLKSSALQVDSIIYFSIKNTNNTNSLWRTDGTANGTFKLCSTYSVKVLESRSNIFAFKNRVFFTGFDTINGDELWVTDGTVQGTKLFYDINKIPGKGSTVIDMQTLNNQLYFKANDGIHGLELWTSDGESNTHMLTDLYPGSLSGAVDLGYSKHLIRLNNHLYFTGISDSLIGNELYQTDGTDTGTLLFRDFNRAKNKGSYPRINAISDNYFTFYVYDSSARYVLYRSDGSHRGTFRIGKDNDYPIGLLISDFYETLNDKTFFGICTQSAGCEYWVSDGSASGTYPLLDINSGLGNSITNKSVIYNNSMIFPAIHAQLGRELWITDGNNTRLLIETLPGNLLSNFLDMTIIGDVLYYSGTTNNSLGIELYKLDLKRLLSNAPAIKPSLSIWPNPVRAGETLKLGLSDAMPYELKDLSGRTIQSGISKDTEIMLNADISAGIYFLSLQTPQGNITKKLQVNK
jgi:ELWxxDGT repeat protein